MKPPAAPKPADYLVLESTYGDRLHKNIDPLDSLEEIVNEIAQKSGVLLIPAFAVGRAQIVLYLLYELKKQGRISQIPAYLNSPMATNATGVFCQFLSEHGLNEEQCKGTCTFATLVRSAEESKELNTKQGPMIIISASGMASGGRILHHLKHFGTSKNNTILLTGFQAAGTRGQALLSGAKRVKIHGEDIPIKAKVLALDNLSAHADQQEIIAWLKQTNKTPRKVFLTHGEPNSAKALKEEIERHLRLNVEIPTYQQKIKL